MGYITFFCRRSRVVPACFALLVISNGILTWVATRQVWTVNKSHTRQIREYQPVSDYQPIRGNYSILWYTQLEFVRETNASVDFTLCKYSNCKLSYDKSVVNTSDAVLFKGRLLPKVLPFKRPKGQIWIYADHESPYKTILNVRHTERSGLRDFLGDFNWTMTYDKLMADIHMPYGEIRQHESFISKDYASIAKNKTKTAVIILSHCKTVSKRLEYIKQLQRYIDVEVLGKCGERWNCGHRWKHDDCFSILNGNYAFYLAFENSFCRSYFTEKLFNNFNYDILFITRGGYRHEARDSFPKGSVIDVDDFKNPADLARYMKSLMKDKQEYAKLLEIKSQYYATTFKQTYQTAMCDLCHHLNHQDQYYRTIPNLVDVVNADSACRDEGIYSENIAKLLYNG